MSFSAILGHEKIVGYFQHAIRKNALAHAYLFVGTEGIGKATFARELAKAVLCKEAPLEKSDACDRCQSCRKFEHGNHPDFIFVAAGSADKFIKIDYVREMERLLYLKPLEGAVKVALIDDAHRMNPEASNCLLKTLEEPPPGTLIILVCQTAEGLFPTIRSRCQAVYFAPLTPEIIEERLHAPLSHRDQIGEETVKFLARVCGGSVGKALRLAEQDLYRDKVWLVEEVASLGPQRAASLAEELLLRSGRARGTSKLQERRSNLEEMLDLLILFLRDAHLLSCAKEVPLIYNLDQETLLENMVARRRPSALEKMLGIVSEGRNWISKNANQQLALETMFHELAAFRVPTEMPREPRCERDGP